VKTVSLCRASTRRKLWWRRQWLHRIPQCNKRVRAVSVVIPSSDEPITSIPKPSLYTKERRGSTKRRGNMEFCEVIVSFIMFKFYEVTEETLQWIRHKLFWKLEQNGGHARHKRRPGPNFCNFKCNLRQIEALPSCREERFSPAYPSFLCWFWFIPVEKSIAGFCMRLRLACGVWGK